MSLFLPPHFSITELTIFISRAPKKEKTAVQLRVCSLLLHHIINQPAFTNLTALIALFITSPIPSTTTHCTSLHNGQRAVNLLAE